MVPLHADLLGDALLVADGLTAAAAAGDATTRAGQLTVEVHTVDTGGRIVLDTKIDVLVNTETERTVLTEVAAEQLVLLDLEALLQDLLGLLTANSDVAGNLLVT